MQNISLIHGGGFTVRRMDRSVQDWWAVAVELSPGTFEVISNPLPNLDVAYRQQGRKGQVVLKFMQNFIKDFVTGQDVFIQFRWDGYLWQPEPPQGIVTLLPPTNPVGSHVSTFYRMSFTGVNLHPNGYHVQVFNQTAGVNYDLFGPIDEGSPMDLVLAFPTPAPGDVIRGFVETLGTIDGLYQTSPQAVAANIIW